MSKSSKRRLAGGVFVRLSDAEQAAVEAAADAAGLTAAAFLRGLAVNSGALPEQARRPSRPRRPAPPEPPAWLAEAAALRETLAETTGALTRSAAFLRLGAPDLRDQVEPLIPVYRRAADAVLRTIAEA